MTTFNWNILDLERTVDQDKVYLAHYSVSAVSEQLDADNQNYIVTTFGSAGFTDELSIPFNSLTSEVVVQWIKDQLGVEAVAELEQSLSDQLTAAITPQISTGLPW